MGIYIVTVFLSDGTFIEVKVYSVDECSVMDFVRDYILDADEIPESMSVRKA